MPAGDMNHMRFLQPLAEKDVRRLQEKELGRNGERGYRGSWKKRGGVGAFMMLARKWDRIEEAMAPDPKLRKLMVELKAKYEKIALEAVNRSDYSIGEQDAHEIIELIRAMAASDADLFMKALLDERPEGLLDDIRDLRRYLLLVDAEICSMRELPHAP